MRALVPSAGAGFLDRLVDRSLGRADVVLPRLPSLFEPVAPLDPGVGAGAGQETRAEPAETPRAQAVHAQRVDDVARADARQAQDLEVTQMRQDATRDADTVAALVARADARGDDTRTEAFAPAPEPSLRGALNPDPAPALASLAAATAQTVAAAAGDVPTRSTRAPPSAAPTNAFVALRVDDLVPSAPRAHGEAQRKRGEPAALAEQSVRESAPHAGVLLPRIRPEAHVPPSQAVPSIRVGQPWSESHGAGASAPIVNVTIGRVEVRAVQAPPGGRPQAAGGAARPLTLVDYLQQRKGRP